MIKIPTLFRTYIWLIDTISRAGRISLAQINERWERTEMGNGDPMHRNTFKRHLTIIEEMFDIVIEYDKRSNVYFLADANAFRRNSMKRWMLNTMTVAGVVRESRSLQDRIILENVPSGDHLLMVITRAMKADHTLCVQYQKFVDSEPYTCELEPYCLKLFHQRWYLLAHRPERTYLAMYSLDRMLDAEETTHPFHLPKDFDAHAHFEHMFGTFQPQPGEKPVRVVLRTYDGEWNYLRTLPLHASQRELKHPHDATYIDFSYSLFPTFDFQLELLAHGDHLEVLEPEDLRRQVQGMAVRTVERYGVAP